MTKAVASWRLERGVPLGQLEQLFGSSTVFGTVSTQFLVGSFNYLALGLFCLWALSPLGGQASLHIISTVSQPSTTTTNITSFNSEKRSFFEISNDNMVHIPTLNGIYLTSLMAPRKVKVSPVDLWGNVKIPIISQIDPNIKANETGWYDLEDSIASRPYSALVGIPIVGASLDGNTTFNIESSYFDIICYNLSLASYVPISSKVKTSPDRHDPVFAQLDNGTFVGSNGTELCPQSGCQISFSLGFSHYAENWAFSQPGLYPDVAGDTGQHKALNFTPTLLFESRYWAEAFPSTSVAHCSVNRIYVESAISCVGDPSLLRKPQCVVQAIRESQKPHEAMDITPFLFPGMFLGFSQNIAQSGGQGHRSTATMTERYLYNSDNPLFALDVDVPLYQLPKRIFSQRLCQVINTYYLASLFPEGMVGGLTAALAMQSYGSYKENATHIVPAVITTSLHDIYVTHGAWLAAFVISSLAMFAAAAGSAVLAHITTTPDILGYVSSLTRDSRYVALPSGGSAMDGATRSRLLKHRVVKFGDVRGGGSGSGSGSGDDERVGFLAFADAERAERAKAGKLYE